MIFITPPGASFVILWWSHVSLGRVLQIDCDCAKFLWCPVTRIAICSSPFVVLLIDNGESGMKVSEKEDIKFLSSSISKFRLYREWIYWWCPSPRKMHILSEVSSTTNSGGSGGGGETMHSRGNGGGKSSSQNNSKSNSNALAPLTAENFAERTIDGLLAEHPGELVRTGCPHVVSFR